MPVVFLKQMLMWQFSSFRPNEMAGYLSVVEVINDNTLKIQEKLSFFLLHMFCVLKQIVS